MSAIVEANRTIIDLFRNKVTVPSNRALRPSYRLLGALCLRPKGVISNRRNGLDRLPEWLDCWSVRDVRSGELEHFGKRHTSLGRSPGLELAELARREDHRRPIAKL